ncbi:peptidylprolyl isomerase [Catenovulum sp. SM1970]|uniref:peptidylprolyl isomerase n=1 Tax=Marinifaba aquimaris TaxID=2741323 RepID=UPI0015721667|nr:peptidylprolyl isomerase [Marinifaba aquimaris]NTS78241.1 peptidylprolyl isomerase [Marinifaba aquimaris]
MIKVKRGQYKTAAALHILTRNEKLANEIKQRADKGESFEKLARQYSNCPSKKKGGNLGEFKKGSMVAAFDNAVFSGELLKPIGPVKTKFGYHIIKVLYRT